MRAPRAKPLPLVIINGPFCPGFLTVCEGSAKGPIRGAFEDTPSGMLAACALVLAVERANGKAAKPGQLTRRPQGMR